MKDCPLKIRLDQMDAVKEAYDNVMIRAAKGDEIVD